MDNTKENDLIDRYIAEGHTQEDLTNEIKRQIGENGCLMCDKPIIFLGSYFDKDGKLVLYGLCKECFEKLKDNKKYIAQIEAKLEQKFEKEKMDTKYDVSNYN